MIVNVVKYFQYIGQCICRLSVCRCLALMLGHHEKHPIKQKLLKLMKKVSFADIWDIIDQSNQWWPLKIVWLKKIRVQSIDLTLCLNKAAVTALHEWVSRVLCPAWHIIGHFGDESFQAISCTGTDSSAVWRHALCGSLLLAVLKLSCYFAVVV